MIATDRREELWTKLDQPWDLVVVGGGITGAGILREAARAGLRVLLVEQRDFAWGTSSRSSKLVHGGLRYLKEGKLRLTRAAVRERERLLAEGAGLVEPLGFLLATYKGDSPGRFTYGAGLTIYDLLAFQWSHRRYSADDFRMLAPHLAVDGLEGGYRYGDAQCDDARLVLRVIQEAIAHGAVAMNYVAADRVVLTDGEVTGLRVADRETGRVLDLHARIVVNATGAWADRLRANVGGEPRMRPLRGSHLTFPSWRFKAAQAVTFLHPADRRPVFVIPWEGVTLVGTTDIDHHDSLDDEPSISNEETRYLIDGLRAQFPSLGLGESDVLATFSGVRPVIGSGVADPSKESRDHVVWDEHGLLTVTGGKLTTFRLIARDALLAARRRLPDLPEPASDTRALDSAETVAHSDAKLARRLTGRFAASAGAVMACAQPGELAPVPGTSTLWAELRWAARAEAVRHLDDLMLRRTRLGLLLPEGGRALLPDVKRICRPEFGWDEERWEAEEASYLSIWRKCYSIPAP